MTNQLIAFCISLWCWHFKEVDSKGKLKDPALTMNNPLYLRKRWQELEITTWLQEPYIGVPKAFSEKTGIWCPKLLREIDGCITSVDWYQGSEVARYYIRSFLRGDDDAKRRLKCFVTD